MKLLLSCLFLLAVYNCVSADNKYNLYYDQNQKGTSTYDSSSSSYSSSKGSSYSTKSNSYLTKINGLTKEKLEEMIDKLYAKIKITTNQLESVLIGLKADVLYTSITSGTTKDTVEELINKITKSTDASNAQILKDIAAKLEEAKEAKVTFELQKDVYLSAIEDLKAAIVGNSVSDAVKALDKAKTAFLAMKATLTAANTAVTSVVSISTNNPFGAAPLIVLDSSVSTIFTNILSSFTAAIASAATAETNINGLSISTIADAVAALLALESTNVGFISQSELALCAAVDGIESFQTTVEQIPLVSYMDFINAIASTRTLDTQLLIQEAAQNTINDAFRIQAYIPSLMKYTYEVIFYAESIQNDAILAGQAAIRIKKLENGPLTNVGYTSNGYSY